MRTLSGTRFSGLALIVAGILFGSFMFFHPANTTQGALETIWVPVHATWFIAYLLILCGFVPLYSLTISQGNLMTVSYWLSFIGTVLSLPIAVWDSFVIPYLAKHSPDFILQIEEISVETPVVVFRIIVFLTVFLFSLGFILFGITSVRFHRLPKFAGACLALGAPLFWIGALFFSKGPWAIMNFLAAIARPLLEWNHNVIMRQGRQGLAEYLKAELITMESGNQSRSVVSAAN